MNKRYTANVEEDENGAYIVFPEEMMKELDWKEGDKINWKDNKNGSYSLTKVKKPVLVLVETVLSYRMRYVVEAPEDHPEYALDTVSMEDAKEFSQLYLGEHISSHRVVSEEEAIKICDQDNDYLKSWTTEQKLNSFVTTMEDQGYKDEDEEIDQFLEDNWSEMEADISKQEQDIEHSKFYYDTERNK